MKRIVKEQLRQNKLLTFALVPLGGEGMQYSHELGVGLVLVDSTQVSDHQVRQTQRLAPGAADLHNCKVNLLAHLVLDAVVLGDETRQSLAEHHLDWGRLLGQTPRCAEPQDVASFSHDHSMRIARRYLNCFVLVKLALLKEKWSGRYLGVIGAMSKLAVGIPSPSVDFAQS